jgi:predicted nucleic acid-binding protein
MNHYADSSFLVSCYVVDANTAQAKAWLSRTGAPLAFTALHGLEVRNAFKLGVFRGLCSASDAAAAMANLEKDLRSGRLRQPKVNGPAALRMAARLSERHSAVTGTRSLDVLHVAAAKTLRVAELVSFDTRQRTLAAAVGLSTSP